MSPLRQSLSCALAGSALVVTAACQDATDPDASTASPSSPAFAKKPAPAPSKPSNLRSTGNTSWSVSLAWDASTSIGVSYRVRDNWGREITVPGTQTSVTWKYPAHP